MRHSKLICGAAALGAALTVSIVAQAALLNVNSSPGMERALPSSYSSSDARTIVQHVRAQCSSGQGGYSDAGRGMTAPSVRVDRTCSQGSTCSGELYVPAGDTIRFSIGC